MQDNPHIAQMDAAYMESRETIADALMRMEAGTLDPEIAYTTCEESLGEYVEAAAATLGIDLENIDNHLDDVIEAESEPTMGQALRALVDDDYDSVESGIMAIAECALVDPDLAIAWYNDEALPSQEQAKMLTHCFASLQANPAAVQHLVELADTHGEFNYSRVALDRVNAELESLKAERAEFAAAQTTQNRLRAIERQATALYNAAAITPFEYAQIVPQDIATEDRGEFVALFSAVAQESGYGTERYLDCLEFHLNCLERRGPIVGTFGAEFSTSIAASGDNFIDDYLATHPYS